MNGKPKLDLGKISPLQRDKMGTSRDQLEAHITRMREREKRAPSVGDPAPDFTLERLSESGEATGEGVRLSGLRGRPVALVFGSYT